MEREVPLLILLSCHMLWREWNEELSCSVPATLIFGQAEGDFSFVVAYGVPPCRSIHFILWATVMSSDAEGQCRRPRESNCSLNWHLLKKFLGSF